MPRKGTYKRKTAKKLRGGFWDLLGFGSKTDAVKPTDAANPSTSNVVKSTDTSNVSKDATVPPVDVSKDATTVDPLKTIGGKKKNKRKSSKTQKKNRTR